MNKLPTWLKIAIPIVLFVGLGVAAIVRLALEELPAEAQPPAIEQRFREQLEFLRETAEFLPFKDCRPAPTEDLAALRETVELWRERVELGLDLFSDPAILGAEMVQLCDGSQNSYGVKPFDELSVPQLGPPSSSWPRASL